MISLARHPIAGASAAGVLLPVLLISLAAPVSAPAQSEATRPAYDGPLHYRPDSPRPPLRIRIHHYTLDGLEGQHAILSHPSFTTHLETPYQWVLDREARGVSIAFHHITYPSVRFSLSLYRPGEFLEEVSATTARGYGSGLQRRYGKDFTWLNEAGNLRPGGNFVTALDSPVFLIHYRLETEDEPFHEFRDYLFMIGESVMVATVSAPADQIEIGWPNVEDLLGNMYRAGE